MTIGNGLVMMMNSIVQQGKIISAMIDRKLPIEIIDLCVGVSLDVIYYAAVHSSYLYADELLSMYAEKYPETLQQCMKYRISLYCTEQLIGEYKEKYGEDDFYKTYIKLR